MKKFYLVGAVIILLLVTPVLIWYLEEEKELKVAIIDKTVPEESYREHLGITWLLNHFRYTNKGEAYEASTDYYGVHPNREEVNLPSDYSGYDVIYLADTYGVYEEGEDGNEKIAGGLEEEEWQHIVSRLNDQSPSIFIAEFNTFASPTTEQVRKKVENYLGLSWSGWTGRYYKELDPKQNEELPDWMVEGYKGDWRFQGEGFVLVQDESNRIVVLEEMHLNDKGISLSFTKEGRERFELEDSPNYDYWFDIVLAMEGTETLATYQWDLAPEGKSILKNEGIPLEFAAVLERTHKTSVSYYFAGDFNDVASVPKFYQAKGIDSLYKLLERYSENAFYWSTYVPMMKTILEKLTKTEGEKVSKEVKYTARINNHSFEILENGTWQPITIKGVNLGMGKPGHFPGEAAVTEEEYYRWLTYIGEMNANMIRVYTLHPPGFYKALKRYNEEHDNKIYVLHGVWINEEVLVESLDAFEEDNLQNFRSEMKTIVDVIHGKKQVKENPGHASGKYDADISPYVAGWILGIEWFPEMVLGTNNKHASLGEYNGTYFETREGQPFEYWLAQQMDYIVKYEKDKYNWIRPMSFTNWVTTDLLDHPAEPSEQEDLVSVNPNVIYTRNDMTITEQFASYHVYPYYPDFFNYEESYQTFKDHRGENNSYAAYLQELHAAHRLPILIAEFGVPASRGLTHRNPFGWNQGFLSEKEQGEIITRLFEDIMAEDLLGGLVFTWQDEWFKRTWNTVDYDNPDRRPYWSNAQTNEQQFGLLSFDRHKIQVDGSLGDWSGVPIYQGGSVLNGLYMDHDERYLYIRLDYDTEQAGYPMFLLDVVPGQGNETISEIEELTISNGIEFIVPIKGDESRLLVDRYYDFFTFQYGHQLNMLKPKPETPRNNSGKFSQERYALNKELYLPQQKQTLPFEMYEAGKLKEGNGNPTHEDYDSLADYYIGENSVEIRLPWLLIRAKDPSQKEFAGDLYRDGIEASKFVEEIFIGALFVNEEGKVVEAYPSLEGNNLPPLKSYTWDNWDSPQSAERLKQSYHFVKSLFADY